MSSEPMGYTRSAARPKRPTPLTTTVLNQSEARKLRQRGRGTQSSGGIAKLAICRERAQDDSLHAADWGDGAIGDAVKAGPGLTQLEGRVGHVNEKVGEKRGASNTAQRRLKHLRAQSPKEQVQAMRRRCLRNRLKCHVLQIELNTRFLHMLQQQIKVSLIATRSQCLTSMAEDFEVV